MRIGLSSRSKYFLTGIGATRAVTPRTKPILARLEPIAFPTAKPPESFKAAFMETMISGAEVPIETTVRPITNDEIPRFLATPTLPLTNLSAPHTRPIKPAIRATIGI